MLGLDENKRNLIQFVLKYFTEPDMMVSVIKEKIFPTRLFLMKLKVSFFEADFARSKSGTEPKVMTARGTAMFLCLLLTLRESNLKKFVK